MPGEEDFGIPAVEALASGKAVIALGRGGILEIAQEPMAGFLFSDPTVEALIEAVGEFERHEQAIDARALAQGATRFSTDVFERKMAAMIGLMESRASAGGPRAGW